MFNDLEDYQKHISKSKKDAKFICVKGGNLPAQKLGFTQEVFDSFFSEWYSPKEYFRLKAQEKGISATKQMYLHLLESMILNENYSVPIKFNAEKSFLDNYKVGLLAWRESQRKIDDYLKD